jgi:N-[(2S)-2-amino-2-carboxyethyl]-L-glutamate dehydrogenase
MLYLNDKYMQALGLMEDEALEEVWEILTEGLIAYGEGRANLPLDTFLRTPKDDQFDRIIAKSGVVEDIAGIKWIASAPLNTTKGLPRATGLLILNDIVTGIAYSILDAVPVSNIRTAGCSMIFLKNFRPNFKRAVMYGAGVHAREHFRQLIFGRKAGFFPHLDELAVYDLYPESAEKFAAAFPEEISVLKNINQVPGDDTAIIYCTNSLVPHVGPEYVKKFKKLTGNHMSLRDYTAEGLAAFDYVAADSAKHVAEANTSVDLAVKAGLIKMDNIYELPKLLIDKKAGKPSPFPEESNVVFNPMGLAVHDLVLGRYVYDKAVKESKGLKLDYL